jgi:hypothetical protein
VNLKPGDNIQAAVDANPKGTVFCLAAGVYARQFLVPKNGNQFIGQKGATLDGQGVTQYAISSGTADHVLVRNLTIKNYTAPVQWGMVNLWGPWAIVQQNEITGATQGAGLWIGQHGLAIGNHIHHNAQEGFKVVNDDKGNVPVVGVELDSNEIDHNPPTQVWFDVGEQGTGKLWYTENATVWYNNAHDNNGPGFWFDYNNNNALVWYNKSNRNWNGVELEISYNASVIGNDLTGNGVTTWCPGWYFTCGAVSVENSGGVEGGIIEIAYNLIQPDQYGRSVPLREQNRGTGSHGPWLVRNVWVHHNSIDVSKGLAEAQVGATNDNGDTAMFAPAANIRFDYNAYVYGANFWFSWLNNGWLTWQQWQQYGQDLNSTSAPSSCNCAQTKPPAPGWTPGPGR